MRKTLSYGALALGILAAGPALTQSVPADAQQQTSPDQKGTGGTTTAPDHTTPPPPNAQPQAPLADQSKPAAVGPSQANTASTIDGNPVPGATPQTTPSTISAENAAKDKLPTIALQFPMNDEQKKSIASAVGGAKVQSDATMANAHVADSIPTAVVPQEFSADLKRSIPGVERYKFVKLDKRVLIVDPTIGTIVSEITL
jgi:hypothetical protein